MTAAQTRKAQIKARYAAASAALMDAMPCNRMCSDCVFFGTTCPGTVTQEWTGCIRKPWNPTALSDVNSAVSRHNIRPAGLAQAIAAIRKVAPDSPVILFYSETADAVKIAPRVPGAGGFRHLHTAM